MNTQIKNLRNLGLVLLAAFAFAFTSCNKEDVELTDIESFTQNTMDGLQYGVIGKKRCLELIFPVTIEFIDESTADVESYMDMKETIQTWFEENDVEKSKENKPQLVFPLQVLNQDGEVIDVESLEALLELKSECPRVGKFKKRKKGKGFKCFSLVFPITITIDGEDQTFDDKMALKAAVRAYKMEAGEDFERPTLVFPVTVEYEDGTQVEVASQDELIELKEACKDDDE